MPIIDLTGQRFGKLVVTKFAGLSKRGQATFCCHCDCGKDIIVAGGNLRRKKPQQSCGCKPHPNAVDPNRTHKRCPACGQNKSIEEFYTTHYYPDGHVTYCKPCACLRAKKNTDLVKRAAYMRHKRAIDPAFRLASAMRGRVRKVLKKSTKGASTLDMLGCTAEELRTYIESLWQPGMSWDNYGSYRGNGMTTWQIDHIRPCASFNLTDPKEQYKCFHYTNLQPLWAKHNLSKHDNIIDADKSNGGRICGG